MLLTLGMLNASAGGPNPFPHSKGVMTSKTCQNFFSTWFDQAVSAAHRGAVIGPFTLGIFFVALDAILTR
jgi:hypothetical protein